MCHQVSHALRSGIYSFHGYYSCSSHYSFHTNISYKFFSFCSDYPCQNSYQPPSPSFVSPENLLRLYFTPSSRSLMEILSSSGPSIDSCSLCCSLSEVASILLSPHCMFIDATEPQQHAAGFYILPEPGKINSVAGKREETILLIT